MSVLQLRNHIPISGPARREPVDGTETPLRVSLGFEPAWFTRRCGVDFSARWHTDPVYRHDTLILMKAELHRAFPSVTYWDPDRLDDTWTLSGCYGAYVVPQMFGCRLRYEADRWPVIIEKPDLIIQELADLDPDALLDTPVMRDLDRQISIIEAEGGMAHGYLNWQGVLNNAFNVLGQDIFTAMAQEPDLAQRFFALITEVMIRAAQHIQARQRASGFAIDQLDVSNCTVNMVSPRYYRRFLFPHDQRIAENCLYFGVHTCNWTVDPYLDDLSKLPKVGYIDMGINSDLARARALFPDARRAVMYSPVKLHDATLDEIEADMGRVWANLAPCDLVMADIQADTPDTRVQALLDICRRLEASGVRETV